MTEHTTGNHYELNRTAKSSYFHVVCTCCNKQGNDVFGSLAHAEERHSLERKKVSIYAV